MQDSDFSALEGEKALNRLERYIGHIGDCKGDCYDFAAAVDLLILRGAMLRLRALCASELEKRAALDAYCAFVQGAKIEE